MSLKLPDYLNPVTRIDNDLFYQFVFHILFQKCHSLVCFPPRAFLLAFLFFLYLLECRKFFFQFLHISVILLLLVQKNLFPVFHQHILSYNAIQLFCATSIDLIVELILSLTDKGELLFIAKVKYRKLQPSFVGNCRINRWGKCGF